MKRVLLLDDDRVFRTALRAYFAAQGWETREAADGEEGLLTAREFKPDLIVCDLLMPRCNGFQFCRTIRGETQSFPNTFVAIITSSDYASDRDNALKAGADAVFVKPVKGREILDAFAKPASQVAISPAPPASQGPAATVEPASGAMIRFWGVRGSIPTPGPHTVKYGGNTSCVEVRADGELIVLDAGTGIRGLGVQLSQEFKGRPLRLTLLITHTHWDHIQGFPFFGAAYNPHNSIRVLSYEGARKGLEVTLKSQMESPYFPISMQQMPGNIAVEEIKEMTFAIGTLRASATFTNHPGVCAAYRLETSAGPIVYMPDNELFRRQKTTAPQSTEEAAAYAEHRDEIFRQFLQDAEVAMLDCQFDAEEYPRFVGWGHSCVEDAVELALAAGVKRFFLFHHDPNHSDEKVEQMVQRAREIVQQSGKTMEVDAAREGAEVRLAPRR